MEWREGECSLRIWRDYCAWSTFLAADLPFEASERWESLLNLFPIFRLLRCQKTTALAAKSPATQAKESLSLSLRSMAVLSSRAHERPSREIRERENENERRSREKNKNRLPGFVAFSTAAPFNSFWHPVDNLFGFSFPSQSEIKCWQPKHDTKARDIV